MTWPDDDLLNELKLPQTNLVVRDEVLFRMGEGKTPIAQFAFSEITDVQFVTRIQLVFPLVFISVFGGLAWACFQFVPNAGLSWTGTVVFGLAALFFVFTFRDTRILIQTTSGDVEYGITDNDADAQGFVMSLNRLRERS